MANPTQRNLFVVGVVLLLGWAAVWAVSLKHNTFLGAFGRARHTWVPAWTSLGLDFLNAYHASNHWLQGGDPYTAKQFGDPLDRHVCYPPVILPLFAWCG